MKTIKKLLALLFALMLLTSCGSSSSGNSSGGSSTQTSEVPKEESKPKTPVLAYEITDTINNIYEADYGMGTKFNVIIEIQNTGDVPLYLKNATIDYEDDNGHLLQTYDFLSKVPDIVQPGEKGYIYTNGSGSFDDGVVFDNGCNLVPNLNVVEAKGELKRYEVEDTSLYTDNLMKTVGIKGRIVNNTKEEVSMLYVTTVYYDSNDKVLGISGTTVTGIAPESKTSFDNSGFFLQSDFTVDDVARYEVYADEMYMQF